MDQRQRFDGSTTALQILFGFDLSGKTILITGGSGGIGQETARSLALHGAHVVISGSRQESCRAARDKILAEKSTAKVSCIPMNLASLKSVREGAKEILSKYPKLDILILNAGIVATGWGLTEDGFEKTFQVNHLAHFYLTLLIESCLHKGSRVLFTSSVTHRFSMLTMSNFSLEKLSPSSGFLFWNFNAYVNSKLCNILHGLELNKRLASRGISVFSIHPGWISTALVDDSYFYRAFFILIRPLTKTLQQGAATTVYCAVAPGIDGLSGGYFSNCWLTEPSSAGKNSELSLALWNLSVEILIQKGFLIGDRLAL